jgi:hypothetical protein
MTPTDRPVTRVTLGAYPSQTGLTGRGYGRARVIAVTIGPGDNIEFRWGGTRQRVSLPIEHIMRHALRIQQRAREADKPKRRKARHT